MFIVLALHHARRDVLPVYTDMGHALLMRVHTFLLLYFFNLLKYKKMQNVNKNVRRLPLMKCTKPGYRIRLLACCVIHRDLRTSWQHRVRREDTQDTQVPARALLHSSSR